MKLQFITNACNIYSSRGKKILTDPWLSDTCFEGSWAHDPPIRTKPWDLTHVDYIYISHLHPDHMDFETLKHFPKDKPIIILDHGKNFLEKMLVKAGFKNFIRIKDRQTISLDHFRLTMYAPFTGHIFYESLLGNLIDSALVVEAENQKILNTNDNTPDVDAAKELRQRHGSFDIAQLNYNAAGPYPSCFVNLSYAERHSEHTRVLNRNIEHMQIIAKILKAKYVMPFAGAYKLVGPLAYKNQYLGTTTVENAAGHFLNGLLLYENDIFDLSNNKLKPADFRYKSEIKINQYDYQKDELPIAYDWKKNLILAGNNLWKAQKRFDKKYDLNLYIDYGSGLYRYSFRSGRSLIKAIKIKSPSLTCYLNPKLLVRILEGKAHWNNAEIGCHIDFDRKPNKYIPDVHTLMSFFHKPKLEVQPRDVK